ncbi:MAG: hypothetical protein GYA42_07930 [Syntrophomonadaceae bacterium]|nr:hypothetical protein [Syntrophomonadaceae bacterium]
MAIRRGKITELSGTVDKKEHRHLAYHNRRWHRENLHYVRETLVKLNLPTRPIDIADYTAHNG